MNVGIAEFKIFRVIVTIKAIHVYIFGSIVKKSNKTTIIIVIALLFFLVENSCRSLFLSHLLKVHPDFPVKKQECHFLVKNGQFVNLLLSKVTGLLLIDRVLDNREKKKGV